MPLIQLRLPSTAAALFIAAMVSAADASRTIEVPAGTIEDKVRGGLLGQLLGNLNGLPHEMKYIGEPGDVREYAPALPDGAWTDDDTDIEWVHVVAMGKGGAIPLAPGEIPPLWTAHISRSIWCANLYARQLMDLGMEPPQTGMLAFNPWSDFNISGQFASECWGLISPGMPATAARIGLAFTRAAIEGEPAQATQLFDAMIATAFIEDDLERILDAGAAAVDPKSTIRRIVDGVRAWHRELPGDWRAARRKVKDAWSRHGGAMRDRNGFELNTASTIAALLYGERDFVKTAVAAFNFGWDADNNAATACTVIGILKGRRWMDAQGWKIRDVYRNTTRDAMPADETITRFGDRLVALAERIIRERGGEKIERDGKAIFRIRSEAPANVEPLVDPAERAAGLRAEMRPRIEGALERAADRRELARAAYEAICLDLAGPLREKDAARWAEAIAALKGYPKLLRVLFLESPVPAGERLRERAVAAGIEKPERAER